MRSLILAALAAFCTLAVGATVQRFPLGKPITEAGIVACLNQEAAVGLIDLSAAGNHEAAQALYAQHVANRLCGAGSAVVVYTKQVHRVDVGDVVWTVYEARIGDMTIYVPMRDFLHESTDL
jgi:hypothetical protein